MKKALFVVTLPLLWASLAFGQRDGVASFTAADSHEFDSVNLTTLVPSFNIPLLGKSRGPLPGSLMIQWPQYCYNNNSNDNSQCNSYPPVIIQELLDLTPVESIGAPSSGCYPVTITGMIGSDGATFYSLGSTTIYGPPSLCSGKTTKETVTTNDGTGITVTLDTTGFSAGGAGITSNSNLSGWTGTYNSNGTQTLADPFNNTLTLVPSTSFTDTLGAVTNISSPTGYSAEYSYKDTTGTTQNIKIPLGSSTTFKSPALCLALGTQNSYTATPVTGVQYPDGTSYSFTLDSYNGTDTGLISVLTLRTGGTITYGYGWSGVSCDGVEGFTFNSLTRTTTDGQTTYTRSVASNTITTTIVDPGANKVVYTFMTNSNNAPPYYLNTIKRYQNTGSVGTPAYTLISSTTYCYNTLACTAVPTLPITQRDTYEYVGVNSTAFSHRVQIWATDGLLTSDATTDQTVTPNQTITTTTAYGTYSNGNCVSLGNTNVQNTPCTITTSTGGTQIAKQTFTYNSNGAPTSSAQWISSTDTLTTNYTVNSSTGTIATITLPNGQVITNTYGNCNSLLLTDSTTTVNSVVIDNKETWNCDAGLVTDRTDPNSNEADYTYDSMNRPSTIHDFMGDTNTTSFAYGTPTLDHIKVTDNIGVVSYQYNDGLGRPTNGQICQTTGCSNLDTFSKSYAWNGTNFETKTYVPCTKTTLNSACTTVALTSDANPIAGPTLSTDANSGTLTYAVNSKDFSVTAGPAPTGEHTKVVQSEVDGFGRVTSTCALQNTGGTSCGQTMGNSGILTSNVYSFATGAPKVVTTNGSQSHTTIEDAIGRTTSVQTPEAGTVTYLYDSDQSTDGCGNRTAAGDLLKITKQSGNYECYITDGLHRITDRANNVTGSGCQRWRYDSTANKYQTAPTGYPSSGNNLIGRLMEAETDSCNSTAVTDEWFAYDKMGRVTDMWESTPNSGGYYHTTVAYDADGVVTSLTSPFSTVTYGNLDGEDRPTSMTYGSTTIVSATAGSGFQYDAASRPTNIPIGTAGNQDAFAYDNVGNMKEYTFNVGTKSDDGTLTWNSIGSLGKLVITDTIASSTDSQSCAYGYDDVARLTGVTSPSGSTCNATETYAYDQYDNMWQSGAFSYACSTCYSSSTNEQTGTPTLTYDSDGNTTNDSNNTYTWNAHGLIASARAGSFAAVCGTSGTCNTYDALGNLVEQVTGSTNQQFLYSPIGQIGVMNGQTTSYAHIPAPGRGYLFVVGTTPYFDHVDWLGTERLVNTVSGSTIDNDQAYTPYGQEYNTLGSSFDLFTGDIKALAGLWHTPNRELLQTGARWLSPDPANAGWNAYAYPTDPNTQTDRSGLQEGQNPCLSAGDTSSSGPCDLPPTGECGNSLSIQPCGVASGGVQTQEVTNGSVSVSGGFWGPNGVEGTDAFVDMMFGNGGIVLGMLNRTSWSKWWQETGCQAGQMCSGAVSPVGGGEWEAPTFTEVTPGSMEHLQALADAFAADNPKYLTAEIGCCATGSRAFRDFSAQYGVRLDKLMLNGDLLGFPSIPSQEFATNPQLFYTRGIFHVVSITEDGIVVDTTAMMFRRTAPWVTPSMVYKLTP